MALDWRRIQADGESSYWSDGSGDGSRTFMGVSPARRLAVVALANAATGVGVDDIGERLLDPPNDRSEDPAKSCADRLATGGLKRLHRAVPPGSW